MDSFILIGLKKIVKTESCTFFANFVGGYIIGLLDHLPQAGEEVTSGNLRFVVDTVERNRIDKVHLYILDAPQKSEESEQESKPER